MDIVYAKAAVKAIGDMDRPTKQWIKKAIEALPDGDVKPLRGVDGLFRLRVGGWRVVFSFPTKDTILVEKISSRGDVYKEGLF